MLGACLFVCGILVFVTESVVFVLVGGGVLILIGLFLFLGKIYLKE